jgi:hypothetical protein
MPRVDDLCGTSLRNRVGDPHMAKPDRRQRFGVIAIEGVEAPFECTSTRGHYYDLHGAS